MREVEDDTVPGGFADGGTAAAREGKAEFGGIEGVEDFLGGCEEGRDVCGGLGVFGEESGVGFEGCGGKGGAGMVDKEGGGEGEVA